MGWKDSGWKVSVDRYLRSHVRPRKEAMIRFSDTAAIDSMLSETSAFDLPSLPLFPLTGSTY